MSEPVIVGIGGTTRPGSTTELLVRAVLSACEAMGARTQMIGGDELLALPHYVPEVATRSPGQAAVVEAVRSADALVIGSPGYHGSVSALVKNAIDLLDDTRTDDRVYLDGCPVGLVVSAAGWQASGVTMSAMRDIVHALRGWPTPIGITINSIAQRPFDSQGRLVDDAVAASVMAQAVQIMSHVAGSQARRDQLLAKV